MNRNTKERTNKIKIQKIAVSAADNENKNENKKTTKKNKFIKRKDKNP